MQIIFITLEMMEEHMIIKRLDSGACGIMTVIADIAEIIMREEEQFTEMFWFRNCYGGYIWVKKYCGFLWWYW